MYYNIYQISQEPIPTDNWITEEDFYLSSFLGETATKISTVDYPERTDEIELLGEWLKKQELGSITDNVLVLNPDMLKKQYFNDRYQKFKEAITAFYNNVSRERYLEDLDGVRNMLLEIEDQLIKQQDHYVCWDSDTPMPLDEFLRTATVGKPYYIGGVCEFKC